MPRLKRWKWDEWAQERAARYLSDMPQVVAIDTETPGTAYYDEPFCVTLTWRGADGSLQNAYIALRDEFGEAPAETADDRIALVKGLLTWTPTWVFHNAKFDIQKLSLVGALPDMSDVVIEDTAPMYGLIDENGSKKLKDLAVRVLKYDDTIEVAYKSGKKKGQTRPVAREKHILDEARRKLGLKVEDGYYPLPRTVVVPYALRDTDFTLLLYEKLKPKLAQLEESQAWYDEVEIPLVDVFLRLEGHGFALDIEGLEAMASEYGVRVMTLLLELQEMAPDVDPESWKQLLPYLQSRGHDIEDTKKATLKKLVDDQYAQTLLAYRKTKKTHTTYLVGLLREQRDGVIHPWFNITGARTGRMSSGSAHE